jgi:hypothetical protein
MAALKHQDRSKPDIVSRTHSVAQNDRNHIATHTVHDTMSTKRETFTHESSRTTGNEPIEAIDPGGTRSTKPGQRHPDKSDDQEPKVRQRVASGDRNTWREPRTAQPKLD